MLKRISLLFASGLLWGTAQAQEMGDPSCDSLILVSSWFNNQVKIYDGCSGQYVQDLENGGLLSGPQKITMTPAGRLLVVSENNAQLVTYDAKTLSDPQVVVSNQTAGFVNTPLAALFDDEGMLYVASYSQNAIVKIDPDTWTVTETVLPAGNNLIQGVDSGLAIHGDYLYVPGYDSDNIIRIHLDTKQAEEFIASGDNGMDAPRGIVFDGNRMLITAERTNSVMEYDVTTGNYVGEVFPALRPAGLIADGSEHLLLTLRDSVYRLTLEGTDADRIIADGAGGLNGATNAFRLFKTGQDSDNDGLPDEEETDTYGTDPNNPDSDGDELLDGQEVDLGTDPLNSDTDADQMPDGFEVTYGLAPLENDAALDLDNDLLSNLEEYLQGTLPNDPDTDNDGFLDGEDVNPLVSDAVPVLRGTPNTAVQQDASYDFRPELEYTGVVSQVEFSIENKPEWAEFSTDDGRLSGQPGNDDVGLTTGIMIRSTDGVNGDAIGPFEIEVININDAPRLKSGQSLPSINVQEGTQVNTDFGVLFEDIDVGDELTFSSDDLIAELTLSEAGVLTGTASTVGNQNFTLTVTDLSGASVSSTVTLTITSTPATTPEPVTPKRNSGGGAFAVPLLFLMLLVRKLRLSH